MFEKRIVGKNFIHSNHSTTWKKTTFTILAIHFFFDRFLTNRVRNRTRVQIFLLKNINLNATLVRGITRNGKATPENKKIGRNHSRRKRIERRAAADWRLRQPHKSSLTCVPRALVCVHVQDVLVCPCAPRELFREQISRVASGINRHEGLLVLPPFARCLFFLPLVFSFRFVPPSFPLSSSLDYGGQVVGG